MSLRADLEAKGIHVTNDMKLQLSIIDSKPLVPLPRANDSDSFWGTLDETTARQWLHKLWSYRRLETLESKQHHEFVVQLLQHYPVLATVRASAKSQRQQQRAYRRRRNTTARDWPALFHMVGANGVSLDVIQKIHDLDPSAVSHCAPGGHNQGYFPLHYACQAACASPEVMEFLVSQYPAAVRTRSFKGLPQPQLLPLHYALTKHSTLVETVEALVHAFPESLKAKDGSVVVGMGDSDEEDSVNTVVIVEEEEKESNPPEGGDDDNNNTGNHNNDDMEEQGNIPTNGEATTATTTNTTTSTTATTRTRLRLEGYSPLDYALNHACNPQLIQCVRRLHQHYQIPITLLSMDHNETNHIGGWNCLKIGAVGRVDLLRLASSSRVQACLEAALLPLHLVPEEQRSTTPSTDAIDKSNHQCTATVEAAYWEINGWSQCIQHMARTSIKSDHQLQPQKPKEEHPVETIARCLASNRHNRIQHLRLHLETAIVAEDATLWQDAIGAICRQNMSLKRLQIALPESSSRFSSDNDHIQTLAHVLEERVHRYNKQNNNNSNSSNNEVDSQKSNNNSLLPMSLELENFFLHCPSTSPTVKSTDSANLVHFFQRFLFPSIAAAQVQELKLSHARFLPYFSQTMAQLQLQESLRHAHRVCYLEKPSLCQCWGIQEPSQWHAILIEAVAPLPHLRELELQLPPQLSDDGDEQSQISTMINLTDPIVNILQRGNLQALTVLGARVDIQPVCDSLTPQPSASTTTTKGTDCSRNEVTPVTTAAATATATTFSPNRRVPPLKRYSVPSSLDSDEQLACFSTLFPQNLTLQEVFLGANHNLGNDKFKHNKDVATIAYHVSLNRCGRGQLTEDCHVTMDAFLHLLCNVSSSLATNRRHPGRSYNINNSLVIKDYQIQYGLLRFDPGFWSATRN